MAGNPGPGLSGQAVSVGPGAGGAGLFLGLRRGQRDLEQPRPQLAGHEQPVPFGVPGDAVEHLDLLPAEPAGGQAAQVDPAFDLFPVGPDDRDSIGSKNIGQDPPPDAFQLVQVVLAPG